ncbi:galactose-1-phosphate uridylyltransferase [Virgibacillus pantothenticus]|uniref:Galactose-1-phosphate uridylyltransferase n=1 Tax=Virgibacillus pantothenticus TaxID=1473 RepID=A0A0L0QMY7_VIRPA|nr:UDP-glucose--hexose-1-phosphate uridylyltransferase [Virgibacillus pantothenticus]KNE19593.1 galactose-1-phosphate uridylyltransferase [Virgibacillus pantothenticus]MBU8565848.1 UDP-glucose--hexose-1-phosphate uridylyltransferase [Virgibacillus pantothenticus]MBU8599565.1 UDP-glucose--hexose-1-phosphate uridylyltransferase [Virgibacillus pantothenticus]MBU8634012.1 UDP-glucose--hexose-1-phosphate uridylyltransferase [Virgibacillus pantothenticus]MBU8642052.1 UDP-glucose--hexose-1-phosphate 
MIYSYLTGLIEQATSAEMIEYADKVYARNQIMRLLHLESFPNESVPVKDIPIPNLLDKLIDYAIEHDVIRDILSEKEILAASIMNCLVARPSTVNEVFYKKFNQSPVKATDYFYALSRNSNYIQMNRIAKNISYKTDTPYGTMDITINLSKPEKDPEQIKLEREKSKDITYPKCLLCVENEGYTGRIDHPARANHRMIRVPLADEMWFFQYSPYVYYNEHSILLSEQHRNMKIDKRTFARLLAFTEKFPHYFIGSNADLPIVGGSILSHDHYQAGRYEFTMTNAKEAFSFSWNQYPQLHCAVLHWPLSVIRLKGKHTSDLVDAADEVLAVWKSYSDEAANIIAFTEQTPHNTITPIARKRNGVYELDLVLRNNRTTEQYPQGIFHPHADVHHIKKENIGLIEVMGLAVLPARLKQELADIESYLLGEHQQVAAYHRDWAEKLKKQYPGVGTPEEARQIVRKEVGNKFVRILQDAGVFKDNSSFKRFIHVLC